MKEKFDMAENSKTVLQIARNIPIKTFSDNSEDDLAKWLDDYERRMNFMGFGDREKRDYLSIYLDGSLGERYRILEKQ